MSAKVNLGTDFFLLSQIFITDITNIFPVSTKTLTKRNATAKIQVDFYISPI